MNIVSIILRGQPTNIVLYYKQYKDAVEAAKKIAPDFTPSSAGIPISPILPDTTAIPAGTLISKSFPIIPTLVEEVDDYGNIFRCYSDLIGAAVVMDMKQATEANCDVQILQQRTTMSKQSKLGIPSIAGTPRFNG